MSPHFKPNNSNAPPNFRVRSFEDWTKRIQINGDLTGVFADSHYVGTGDTGGSPSENSVKLMEAIETKSTTVIPPMRFNFFGRGQQEEPPSPAPAPVKVGGGPDVPGHPEVLQDRSHTSLRG